MISEEDNIKQLLLRSKEELWLVIPKSYTGGGNQFWKLDAKSKIGLGAEKASDKAKIDEWETGSTVDYSKTVQNKGQARSEKWGYGTNTKFHV